MARDFAAELRMLDNQINQAHQEQGRLQGEKAGLNRQKNEIVATCTQLGVEPKRESIENEIATVTAKLSAELSAIDTALKAVAG